MHIQICINRVYAEVLNRSLGDVRINISVKIELQRFSAEIGAIEFVYRIEIMSRVGHIAVDGVMTMFAESDNDREELKRLAEESKKGVPPYIAQIIVLNVEPLVLILEKEMGMPITPIILQMDEDKGALLYQ